MVSHNAHSPAFLAVPVVTADEFGVWDEEDWGFVSVTLGSPTEHRVVEIRRVPEGMLVHGQCRACGGFRDYLIAVDPDAAIPTSEEFMHQVGPSYSLMAIWLEEHDGCASAPKRYQMPADLVEVAESGRSFSDEVIARGDVFRPMLHLITEKAHFLVPAPFEIPDGADAHEYRRVETQRLLCSIRRMIAARDLDLRAACFVSEVWVSVGAKPGEPAPPPSQDENRTEGVMVVAVTAEFGTMGLAPIVRPKTGPAHLAPIEWRPFTGSHLLDGLFATTSPSQEQLERARAAGIEIHVPNAPRSAS